jgi:hypothetical protein
MIIKTIERGDHMKKIFLITIALLLSTTILFAQSYDLTYNNTACLADGIKYATVVVTDVSTPSKKCFDINITLNGSAFTKGPNFGMQKFGFNYTGTIDSIAVSAPDFYTTKNEQQMDGFGTFDKVASATGIDRVSTLTLTVCGTADLTIEGCFSVHIADFILPANPANYCDECVSSAFFGNCDAVTKKPAPTEPCDETAITLSSFTAQAGKGSVTINWRTETEINNAGFNIYRAESIDGTIVKINGDVLIPAEGSGIQGASYQFIDTAMKNRFKTYLYILEDVEFDGDTELHGPISVAK